MIVRILGEGQFVVPDDALNRLNDADEDMIVAIAAGDQDRFRRDLAAIHAAVHELGTPMPPDHLGPSDLVLPAGDATLEEVQSVLGDEGLIPG